MTAASSAPTVKAALKTLVATAVGDQVLVTYGHPGFSIPDDVVSIGNVEGDTEVATLSTLRKREETLQIALTVSCYRGGGPEVQQAVTERAYALLSAVFNAIQTDPTIGGTCRYAAMPRHVMTEDNDPDTLAAGRVTEIVATVQAATRI